MFPGGNGVRGVMGCGVEFRLPDFDRRRSLIALCFFNIIWSSPLDLLSLQPLLDGLHPEKGVLQLLLNLLFLSLFIPTKWNISVGTRGVMAESQRDILRSAPERTPRSVAS